MQSNEKASIREARADDCSVILELWNLWALHPPPWTRPSTFKS